MWLRDQLKCKDISGIYFEEKLRGWLEIIER